MKRTKPAVKPALRKAYRAVIQPDTPAILKIVFLSKAMIHLWNMAQEECESRLTKVSELKKVGTKEIPGDLGISSISLNYWLIGIRQSGAEITLENGETVRLDGISNDMEREVLRKLAGSYSSFFQLKKKNDFRAKRPGQKKESDFQTLSWTTMSRKENMLFVSGANREQIALSLKAKAFGGFSSDYLVDNIADKKVVHATLSRNVNGEFKLSLVVSQGLPKKIENPKFFRAIDLGAGDIAITDSDGSEYLIPARRPDKFWMEHILGVEDRQKNRTRGSREWLRLAEARKKMHNRSHNQKESYQRKLADAVVSGRVECIVIGKGRNRLGLSQTKKGTADQHYGVQNTGYMFRQLLYIKEKAEERGIRVVELPDPQRKGSIQDPQNKFFASRELLRQMLKSKELPMLESFVRKEFQFDQGRGVAHPHHVPGRQNTLEFLQKQKIP